MVIIMIMVGMTIIDSSKHLGELINPHNNPMRQVLS